jgi:hypothetical protein
VLRRLGAACFLNQLPSEGCYSCRVGVCALLDHRVETSYDEARGAWENGVKVVIDNDGITLPCEVCIGDRWTPLAAPLYRA